jgi:isoleucyl-tRNA synthetase
MSSYQKIPSIGFSKLEDQIISFWKENKIFEKSVESRPAENTYSFIIHERSGGAI